MALKKDKEKVLDEVWTSDRVKEFLAVEPATGVDGDFHMLQKAYQSMRADNFEEFIGYYLAEGRNINAADPSGKTVLAFAKAHKACGDFVTVLEANGAN